MRKFIIAFVVLLSVLSFLPAAIAASSPGDAGHTGFLSLSVSPSSLTVTAGQTATAALTAENAQGSVTYSASVTWVTFSGNTATFAPTTAGTYSVTISATDETGTVETTVTVTVIEPLSLSVSPSSLTITAGQTATAALTAENAQGSVTYSASVTWVTFSGNTATFAPTTAGTYSVTISATDETGTVETTVTVTVIEPLSLSVSPSSLTITAGQTATATLTAENAQGSVTYSANASWVTFSGNTATFAPTTAGTYSVTISATDSAMPSSDVAATASISVTVNAAPTFSLNASSTALTLTLPATENVTLTPANESGTVTYTADQSWITFNGNTAVFAPTAAGTYTVNITAADDAGNTASVSIAVTVNPAPLALAVNPSSLTITVGSSAAAALTVSNALGAVSYSANASWVTFNENTATFSPESSGTYTVSITATDSGRTENNTAAVSVTVTVNPAAFSLTANPSSLTITAGSTSTLSLTPANALGTVSYTASEEWVTFSENTATFSPAEPGTYTVSISASDSGRTENNTAAVSVTVTVNPAAFSLTVNPSSLTITAGNSATAALNPSNILGTVSYTASEEWVTFSENTAIFSPDEPGTYTVSITATDSGRTEDNTAAASIAVNVVPLPFSLTVQSASLTITAGSTSTLSLTPANAVGTVSYTASESWVTFSGNTAIFSPAAPGAYTVSITASDSGRTENNTAAASIAVNVVPLPFSLTVQSASLTITAGSTSMLILTPANALGTVRYTASESWVTFSGNIATFSPAEPGTYTVSISASDSGRTENNTAAVSVTVTVTPAVLSLNVNPAAATIALGNSATIILIPANIRGTVSYSASETWVTFSENTAILSPTSTGSYTVTITAADSEGYNASAVISLTVTNAEGSMPGNSDEPETQDTPVEFVEPSIPPSDTPDTQNEAENPIQQETPNAPVSRTNTVRPNTSALREIVLTTEVSSKISTLFPEAANSNVFSLVGNSNITMNTNAREISSSFMAHLQETGEEVMLAFPSITASEAGIYVLGVSLKDIAEAGTLIDSVSDVLPAANASVRSAADIESINLLDQAGNPIETKRATNGRSYAVVPDSQNMLVAVNLNAGESWIGSLTKPVQLPTILVETITINQIADIAQQTDEQTLIETREETVERITSNIVEAVQEIISRPEVIENIISNPNISNDILSRDITSADIKTFTSRDVVVEPEEPTAEMVETVKSDGYEIAAKLNTIQVAETGFYVFKVTLSDQSFTELKGAKTDELKVYAMSDSEIEIAPAFITGLLNTFELLSMTGEKMDTIGVKEFLLIGLLESSKPLSLYLAKLLIMLLLGGCDSGLGIYALLAVSAGIIYKKFHRK